MIRVEIKAAFKDPDNMKKQPAYGLVSGRQSANPNKSPIRISNINEASSMSKLTKLGRKQRQCDTVSTAAIPDANTGILEDGLPNANSNNLPVSDVLHRSEIRRCISNNIKSQNYKLAYDMALAAHEHDALNLLVSKECNLFPGVLCNFYAIPG